MNDEAPTRGGLVRLAAAGDILLAAPVGGRPAPRDSAAALAGTSALFAGCDVVFGNLECTLPGSGGTVATEPRVVATAEMVRSIRAAGFTVVTLANNHMFDCLDDGFHRLRDLLGELGVAWFGAGDTLDEAAAPAVVESNGLRLAFVGAADRRSGASRFATPTTSGVAPLDVARLVDQIRRLRGQVDRVIVSLHWGEERLAIPSPAQVQEAHALVEAGADLVLGHHPHVLQGLEVYRGTPIIYSLGNFLADDVGYTSGDRLTWTRTERTGCVLLAEVGPSGVENVRQVATCDDGRGVAADASGFGERRIAHVNRALARGVTLSQYRRHYLWVKTVKPALAHLRWSELKRLRPAKIQRALASLLRARRAE